MDVRILCYNILHGGYSRRPDEGGVFQSDRFEAIRSIIKTNSPDIAVLIETYPSDRPHSPEHTLKKYDYLDFPYHAEGAPSGRPHLRSGISILSRLPIAGFEDRSVVCYPWLRVQLDNGKPLVIDGVHPYPSPRTSECDRTNFIGSVIERKKTNYILAGDFNSYDPHVTHNSGALKEVFAKERNGKSPEALVEDLLHCKVYRKLQEAGLTDSYRAVHGRKKEYTMPTGFANEDKGAAERIDYIWASPDIRVRDAGIIRGEDAERGSDHYPIFADLAINAL